MTQGTKHTASQEATTVEVRESELTLEFGGESLSYTGAYQITPLPDEHLSIDQTTGLSFDHLVRLQGVNHLVHPEDISRLAAFIHPANEGELTIRLITPSLQLMQIYLKGSLSPSTVSSVVLPSSQAYDRKPNNGDLDWDAIEQDLREHKLLLESVIQSDIVGLSVLIPVQNVFGEIEDFEWLMTNKLQQAFGQGQKLVGKRYCQVFPASRDNGVFMTMKAAFITGERREAEVYHEDSYLRGWLRIVAVRSADSLIVSSEDVTPARKAEEELRKNLSILQQTEEFAHTGSWEWDVERKTFIWSEGMYILFGLPSGTPVTPDIYSQMAASDEDKLVAGRIINHITREPQPFTKLIRIRVDQKVKSVNIRATVATDGNRTRVTGIDQDVTDVIDLQLKERRAQAQLVAVNQELARQVRSQYLELFHSIDQGLAILKISRDTDEKEPDMFVYQANGAFEKLIGQPETQWRSLRELLPDLGAEWCPMFVKIARGGKPMRFVVPGEKTGGKYLELYAFRSGAQPSAQEVVVLVSDITERCEKELQLSQLNSQLKAMNTAKTKFLDNVSHEFRTPLTLMLGPIRDIIASKHAALSNQDLEKLQLAERNVLRLQKLVNNLLDFSRIENGRLDTFYQPTNLAEFTNEIASGFKGIIEQAGLQYSFKAEPISEPIFVNRDMWEKIVLNLMSNAFKFTRRGKIEVRIVEKRYRVQVSIRDTGVGISEKNLPRLFQRFVRFEDTAGRTVEGTGIGLSLIKELVNMHGGDIHVKSQPGKGSTFTVTIPKGTAHLPAKQLYHNTGQLRITGLSDSVTSAVDEARAWLPGPRRIPSPQTAGKTNPDKPAIIVVDDNADMREYLKEVLSAEYHVILLGTGKQAFDFLSRGYYPDLIISDVMMPEMDGYELTQTIKKSPKFSQIPVILLSARNAVDDKAQGIRLGADDYIEKPFTSRELRTIVAARLQVAQASRELEKVLQMRRDSPDGKILLKASEVESMYHEVDSRNDELRGKNVELESLNEQLLNFTFIASHDLREPLRKIRVFAHRLADHELIKDQGNAKVFVEKILTAAALMNTLFEEVLEFSRTSFLPGGTPELVDLNERFQRALEQHRDTIKMTKASIECSDLATLKAMPSQVLQLLEHLLSNALKYQPKHIPVVKVNGFYTQGSKIEHPGAKPDQKYYCLQVIDNGIGFDNKHKEKIFHLFQRLHGRSEFSGTGLGLALCQKIMEKHKGFIDGNGTPGVGSTFSCYFPL
jgi:signal transduction histidine kinase